MWLMEIAREELVEIRAYDEAKSSNDEAVPLEQALREIEDESNDHN